MADTLQLPAVIQPAQIETGMTIRVHHKIKDIDPEGKEKERVQMFEGLVLKTSGAGNRKTMTI
jgi:ribosomal protein L19